MVDVGGDDRGALALGRWRDAILQEGDYEMLFVINCFRPLTATPEDAVEVMREIEIASGIPFTAVVNNSNLGDETTARDVLESGAYAANVCAISALPLKMTTVREELYPWLEGEIGNLFPLRLQEKIR